MQNQPTSSTTSTTDTLSQGATELLQQEIDQFTRVYNIAIEFLANYSFQLIGAMIILLIGFLFAGKIANGVRRLCERNKLDVTLSRFLSNASRMLIVILVAS